MSLQENTDSKSPKETNYRSWYIWISLGFLAVGFLIGLLFKFYEDKGALTALIDVTLTSVALTIAILEILELRSRYRTGFTVQFFKVG